LLSKRSTSSRTLRDQRSLPKAPARESASRPHQEADSTPAPTKAKKHLLDAPNECISLHQQQKAWNAISIGQVRTALALFDYACGGGILIEDLRQQHVSAFTELCRELPNRWGRTTEEKAGGIAASLAWAETLSADEIGLGQATIN